MTAPFNLTVVDDAEIDGVQLATVTASAGGFTTGSRSISIYDNESPPIPFNPSPADLATNVIQNTALSWQSGAVAGEVITNDVYFGTNPTPGAGELLGSTTNTTWTLSTLAPLTTYYWQIVARKAGATAGPIWRFTTRGLDHFEWASVSLAGICWRSFFHHRHRQRFVQHDRQQFYRNSQPERRIRKWRADDEHTHRQSAA